MGPKDAVGVSTRIESRVYIGGYIGGYKGVIGGLYRNTGKENGSCYLGFGV